MQSDRFWGPEYGLPFRPSPVVLGGVDTTLEQIAAMTRRSNSQQSA
jgi:hypothetical protein